MPVYRLTKTLAFPSPNRALADGLLAVGGDLSPERLLLAYSMGIFPWYNPGDPILWWSPDPRMILLPHEFHVSRRLARLNRNTPFRVTMDTSFDDVIVACATTHRPGQNGTWITGDMINAYAELHRRGYAHSLEAWLGGELVGGVYGVSLGSCFFGESMFAARANASKIAFVRLVEQLRRWAFTLIDCQVHTQHLFRFGAQEIPRSEFLDRLARGIQTETRLGPWTLDEDLAE